MRRFSFPLDWDVSNYLSDICSKLDGIAAYLDDGNAVYAGKGRKQQNAHFIQDSLHKIISVHDFPINKEQDWTLHYPSYKEMLNYGISKINDILATNQSVLFSGWGTLSILEAVELHSILAGIAPRKYKILYLDPKADITDVKELDWNVQYKCPSRSPNDDSM